MFVFLLWRSLPPRKSALTSLSKGCSCICLCVWLCIWSLPPKRCALTSLQCIVQRLAVVIIHMTLNFFSMRMAGSLDRRNDKRIAKVETDMWTMKLMSVDYYRPEGGVHWHRRLWWWTWTRDSSDNKSSNPPILSKTTKSTVMMMAMIIIRHQLHSTEVRFIISNSLVSPSEIQSRDPAIIHFTSSFSHSSTNCGC